jgi:hypothetical protein
MARANNALTLGMTGTIAKQIVYRTRGRKTFASKYPDMSNVKPSEEQLKYKFIFGEAVRYAQGIIRDPKKKAVYKVKKGASVYHTAIRNFMREHAAH